MTTVSNLSLVVLAIGMLVAVSLFAGTGPNVYALGPGPSVVFEKDEVFKNDDSNPNANGMKVAFRGLGTLSFSKDGDPVGTVIPAPPGADDFTVSFDSFTCVISDFFWTKKGKPFGSVSPPSGANDLHFETTDKIKRFKWTVGGKNKETVGPKKADALDFFCTPP